MSRLFSFPYALNKLQCFREVNRTLFILTCEHWKPFPSVIRASLENILKHIFRSGRGRWCFIVMARVGKWCAALGFEEATAISKTLAKGGNGLYVTTIYGWEISASSSYWRPRSARWMCISSVKSEIWQNVSCCCVPAFPAVYSDDLDKSVQPLQPAFVMVMATLLCLTRVQHTLMIHTICIWSTYALIGWSMLL